MKGADAVDGDCRTHAPVRRVRRTSCGESERAVNELQSTFGVMERLPGRSTLRGPWGGPAMRRFTVGLLIVVSAVCLVLSSTSLWTRRHVVNTDVFVAGGQAILADPAVQGAIDAKVVDTIMTNPEVQGAVNDVAALLPPRLQRFKPALEDEVRDLLSSGVHAVLTSDRFSLLTEAALRSVQTQLLAGQPVRFTLGQAKARIPQQDRTGLAGEVINLIPDDVGFTVLTPQQAPQLYTAIDLLKTLWLWVGLLGLAALIGALVISRRRRRTLRAWSVTTAVLGLLLVIAMRVAQGPVLIHVKPANAAAATAIYEGVTASLRAWTLWFVAIPVVVLVFTLVWGRLGIIPGIRRGYRAAVEQVRSRREAHELAQDAAVDGIDPRPAQSWTHRVAADTRTFIDGVGMSSWLDRLGGFVRRHLSSVRWVGVAAGALVLLLWPAPTLTVLIWVVALIALYLGLLEWLQSRAADPVSASGQAAAVPPASGAANGVAAASRTPAPPPARPATRENLSAMGSRLDLLMRLGEARTAGVLTDDEFAQEKTHLLAPPAPHP